MAWTRRPDEARGAAFRHRRCRRANCITASSSAFPRPRSSSMPTTKSCISRRRGPLPAISRRRADAESAARGASRAAHRTAGRALRRGADPRAGDGVRRAVSRRATEQSIVDIRVSPADDLAPDFLLVVFIAHARQTARRRGVTRSAEADQVGAASGARAGDDEGAAARDDRAVRGVHRGAEGEQRRAAGDERGAAFRDRGTGDEPRGIAVDQRGTDDGEPGAEEQGRSTGATRTATCKT